MIAVRMVSRVLLLPVGLALACTSGTRQPNIILIYIDDLGWRDLGVSGNQYVETPNIDALASEGLLFTDAYANAPNCAPSRASLISGQYTPRHGIYTVGSAARGRSRFRKLVPVRNKTALDLSVVTIAEALAPAGYTSGHVGKWHLGGEGNLPTDQGFDWSVAGNELGRPPSYFYPYGDSTRSVPGLRGSGREGEYLTDRLTDEAIRFIQEHRDRPFFLYLSHYAVHTPLQAKPELIEHYRAKPGDDRMDPIYAAMVHSTDEGVGRVLDALDMLELSENTVVIFHSDNGGFGPATSMEPLRGSKGMLYEGGIREPLIIRWRGGIAPGVSHKPVIGSDLYPTILALAGAAPPGGHTLDGVSLLPLLIQEGEFPARRPLFWHFPAYLEADRSVPGPWRTTPAGAIRLGDYKLIEFFEDGRQELYNLREDIGEQHDLASRQPEKTRELLATLRAWRDAVNAPVPTEPNPEYHPGTAAAQQHPR